MSENNISNRNISISCFRLTHRSTPTSILFETDNREGYPYLIRYRLRLKGVFAPAFYRSYMQENPLPENWQYRENIYKLYHILNHLNLFGRSYLSEAEYIIESYTR